MLMTGTMIEQILQAHSDDEVAPGEVVWIDIDVRSARDFGGANVVKNLQEWYPDEPVLDPGKTFFTFDCVAPANNIPYANNQQICRTFAREHGVEVYDVDCGIGSHVMIENGIAVPGSTVVGTDSHLNLLGAIGAFGQGMGDQDIAFAFKTGRTWFEVPETMRVEVIGRPSKEATPRDLTLAIVGDLGSRGCLGKAAEFDGRPVKTLTLDGRITLASMATEMGAVTGMIPPDRTVIEYCTTRAAVPFEAVKPADDAIYSEERTIDVDGLGPMIARPSRPDDVIPVSEVGDIPIDSAFIGSCTNGRYEDISRVAEIVEGRHIHRDVFAMVVPSTNDVYGRLLMRGEIQTLHQAGFIVMNSGCGGCASGQAGMTGEGQVQVSTSNRNFKGKQGAGDTYLASPETVAASALAGRIVTHEEVV